MSGTYIDTMNTVKPVKFVIEPPTLISLGFEWYIEGDDNHNARVEVQYRKKVTRTGNRHYLFYASRMKKASPSF